VEEPVEGVDLRQKVLSPRRMSFSTIGIHKVHLILVQNPLIMYLDWQLKVVIQPQQCGKLSQSDLILVLVSHPNQLLTILVKGTSCCT
jgi:hypothetical protein